MATIGQLMIDLGMNVARLQKDVSEANRTVDRGVRDMKRTVSSLQATLQGVLVGSGILTLGRQIATEVTKYERETNRLNAVIRATGGAAGLTRDELDAMAESLGAATTFDAGDITMAQSELMKFGNVHGQVFRGAMKISADLASFMGTEVPAAAQMVGRALQSPTEGITLLERVIGKLTQTERDHIETLARQGDAFAAQNAVLDLLQKRLGGTAEIMNTGLTAATSDAAEAWRELLEDFGKTDAAGGLVERRLRGIAEILDYIRQAAKPDTDDGRLEKMNALQTQIEALEKNLAHPQAAARAPFVFGSSIDDARARLAELKKELLALNQVGIDQRQLAEAQRQQAEFEASHAAGQTRIELGGRTPTGEKKEKSPRLTPEQILKMQMDGEEELSQQRIELAEHVADREIKAAEASAKAREEMARQVFDTIDREQEEAILAGAAMLADLEEQAKTNADVARELGLTFTSAFEDAIVKGMEFKDVLKGIGQDIARIIARKYITEPLAKGIDGIDFGSFFSSGGGGGGSGPGAYTGSFAAFADGGRPSPGDISIVGERGPELFIPDAAGTVVPNHMLGGNSVTVNNGNIIIHGGASGEVTERRLRLALAQERRVTLQAVMEMQRR